MSSYFGTRSRLQGGGNPIAGLIIFLFMLGCLYESIDFAGTLSHRWVGNSMNVAIVSAINGGGIARR
jgi:hypothetical protein